MPQWIPQAIAFLIAITLHEAAHAFVAYRLGDPTARDRGRVTLNPLKHLDPAGTLVFFLVGFGWAKPVPVQLANLKHPTRDHMWIAAAGPGANIALAIIGAVLWRIWSTTGGFGLGTSPLADGLYGFLWFSITLNLLLAVFNLIPLAPLDGSAVLAGLLPSRWLPQYERLNTIGPAILIGAIGLGAFTGISVIGRVLWPPVLLLRSMLTGT